MESFIIVELASILVIGFLAQWIAWRMHLPSIFFLLVFGFLAGPIFNLLHPDRLFGEILAPFVSLSVAVILFEGGLNLRFSEFRKIGTVLIGLLVADVLITVAVVTASATFLLGFSTSLALLMGCILVVTGPTVILPLLQHIKPAGKLGILLKWEGIVIDPIGAMLAVLVFEGIVIGSFGQATVASLGGIVRTVLAGGILGVAGSSLMIFVLSRHWIPDYLQNMVTLSMVFAVFVLANMVQSEAGLFSVTVMGLMMANQRKVVIEHIMEFKENLQVLLISLLFIILSARLNVPEIKQIWKPALVLLVLLIAIARPISVVLGTLNSSLKWKERFFLSSLAPRGIVAAAVASIFSLRLSEMGVMGAEKLTPITFFIIIGTVTVYGFIAAPLSRLLKVAQPFPQGVLIAGAHSWGRKIARLLMSEGFRAVVADTNRENIAAARHSRIASYHGNILSEKIFEELDFYGLGKFMALTPNDEVNSLAVLHFADVFGRSEVYQLAPAENSHADEEGVAPALLGRILFGGDVTYRVMNRYLRRGGKIKKITLQTERDVERFHETFKSKMLILFAVSDSHKLLINTADNPILPEPGLKLIVLVPTESLKKTKTSK